MEFTGQPNDLGSLVLFAGLVFEGNVIDKNCQV